MPMSRPARPEGFSYGNLNPEVRSLVRARTAEIQVLVQLLTENILDIGQKLKEVKIHLGEQKFLAWIVAEFQWSESTALRYIRVYESHQETSLESVVIEALGPELLALPAADQRTIIDLCNRLGSLEVARAVLSNCSKAELEQIDIELADQQRSR